jgi:exosome complex component RRP46
MMEVDGTNHKTTEHSDEVQGEQRLDGRLFNQLRPMMCEQGLLNRADGSVKYSQDKSTVLVAVYGPIETKRRRELLDRASIEVMFRPRSGIAGYKEKEYEHILQSTAENFVRTTLHPRTGINIMIQVLQEDGSLLSTAINAMYLALVDAGISTSSLCGAVTCVVTKDGGLLLDPADHEEQDAASIVTLGFTSTFKGLACSNTQGLISNEGYFQCLQAAESAVSKVFAFMRVSIERKLVL